MILGANKRGGIISVSHLLGTITVTHHILSSGAIQCIDLRIVRAAAVVKLTERSEDSSLGRMLRVHQSCSLCHPICSTLGTCS